MFATLLFGIYIASIYQTSSSSAFFKYFCFNFFVFSWRSFHSCVYASVGRLVIPSPMPAKEVLNIVEI